MGHARSKKAICESCGRTTKQDAATHTLVAHTRVKGGSRWCKAGKPPTEAERLQLRLRNSERIRSIVSGGLGY